VAKPLNSLSGKILYSTRIAYILFIFLSITYIIFFRSADS
jgi:hypothetical protein